MIIPFYIAPVLRSFGILNIILGTLIWKDTLGIWQPKGKGVMCAESYGKTAISKYAAEVLADQKQRMDETVL